MPPARCGNLNSEQNVYPHIPPEHLPNENAAKLLPQGNGIRRERSCQTIEYKGTADCGLLIKLHSDERFRRASYRLC